MCSWRPRRANRSRSIALLGILCVLFLLVGATVQAVHTHEDGGMHGDCALCLTPHAILATVDCLTLLFFLECISQFSAEQKKNYFRFNLPFALSNRPPPGPAAVS